MSGLHKGAIYTELASVRLVGMMLTVAVKSTIYPKINDCLTAAVGTGTLKWVCNVYDNRRSAAIKITIDFALRLAGQ